MVRENGGTSEAFAPELMGRVRQIQVRTHRLVDDVLSGAYRSTFRGSGIEFEEVRPYQPGDDVRTIDWNRTARQAQAYVKTYVEERELTLSFLVDTSRSMDFGTREATKRETAAAFCALLAFVALRQQDRVGLSLFGETPGLHLPPRKGAGAVARVVREVIAAPPSAGGTGYRAALEQAARTLRRRALVFLVSDFLSLAGEGRTDWEDALRSLARRHDVIAVRAVDRFEEELPEAGWITFSDLETGAELDLDTRSRRVREAWAARARERREALGALLARSKVDLIELDTGGSVADPVIRFFKTRRLRRGAKP